MVFPEFVNDPFYQQFDNPARAYSNLPGSYMYYLDHWCNEIDELDHITYARALAIYTSQGPIDHLPSKKELLDKVVMVEPKSVRRRK